MVAENDFTPAQLTGHEIIERYHAEDLRDKPIFDLVPRIVGMSQMWILDNWAEFYRKKNVPFIIARKPATRHWQHGMHSYSLWKERYVF